MTTKLCRVCETHKPPDAFRPKSHICRTCRSFATVQRRREREAGIPAKPQFQDFTGIPKHEYTDDDRAWQSARLPVFNRGLLAWRLSA